VTEPTATDRDEGGAVPGRQRAPGGPGAGTLADLGAELVEAAARLETAAPTEVITWARERFDGNVALACSFQDAVVVDLAVRVDPAVEVVFLDTGAHFDETLAYVAAVRDRYGLNLTVTHPGPEAEAWPCGTERCCELRKVAPLRAALAGRPAWLTGLKRVDAPTRAAAPVVAFDPQWGMVKVNPLATWTDDDVAAYERDHGLPRHPLFERGYRSIGCAPTTRPTAPGEDPRAGRWAGTEKTECGLHAP
jgi:phosphoadenosine phosphosulfate reductase